MKRNKTLMSWPGRSHVAARATCAMAFALLASRADAATGVFSSSSLPLLLVMLPLLAALAYAARSWMPRLPGRSGDQTRRSGQAADWTRLATQARQFFDAHGLEGLDPQQDWIPARDLMLHRDQRACLVRARLWRARQIDAVAVQQMARDIARVGASRGILLCARNVFTPAAHQLARQQRIMLLDPSHMLAPASPRAPAPGRSSMLAGLEPAATTRMPAPEEEAVPELAPTLLRPPRPVRARASFQPTEPLLDQPERDAAKAARGASAHAPLLGEWKPAPARPEFQPTEPLLDQPERDAAKAARGASAHAPLLGEWKPAPARPEFQPTEPLLDQPERDAAKAARGASAHAPLLGEWKPAPARPEFQPTEPLLDQPGRDAAGNEPAPLLADWRPAAQRREFQPTEPLLPPRTPAHAPATAPASALQHQAPLLTERIFASPRASLSTMPAAL